MKKNLLYTFALCMAFLLSCSNDTATNNGNNIIPTTNKKLVQRFRDLEYSIEYSYDGGITWDTSSYDYYYYSFYDKWNWNDDKINSIEEIFWTKHFYYDDNDNVTKITFFGNEYITFTYDNALISDFQYYENNIHESSYHITYSSKGKPTKVSCTFLSDDKVLTHKNSPAKRLFQMSESEITDFSDKALPYADLTWDNNNLQTFKCYAQNELKYSASYTYDNMANPFYSRKLMQNLIYVYTFYISVDYINGYDNVEFFLMSANNRLSTTVYTNDGEASTLNYIYNYDNDGVPTDVARTYYSNDNQTRIRHYMKYYFLYQEE